MITLREIATPEEKQKLKDCFGNSNLIPEQIDWLLEFVVGKLPREEIYNLILENYKEFLNTMENIVAPEYIILCQNWFDYKINQAKALLLQNR
ncbi:MAG: hypothetical protein KatS3mg090_0105 [Patescibacteria group bacterium]|nr:MAG: hypothetical protein KatS3mg090_0105 [Patescibacteria group bacterium]